jgi:hypothetical protein
MQNITEPSITSDFEKIVNCNVIIEEDELSALQQRADHPIQENEKKSFILAGKSLDDQTAELVFVLSVAFDFNFVLYAY